MKLDMYGEELKVGDFADVPTEYGKVTVVIVGETKNTIKCRILRKDMWYESIESDVGHEYPSLVIKTPPENLI